MTGKVRTFRYVRWRDLLDYLAMGWMVMGDLGAPHGEWSVLMEWRCVCPCPVKP